MRSAPGPAAAGAAGGVLIAGLDLIGHWLGATAQQLRYGMHQLGGGRHSRVEARRGPKH